MEAYYNDGRTAIIVVDENGEAEEFTKKEFIAAYGKESLPDEYPKPEVVVPNNQSIYWLYFERLVEACGKYAWAKKLQENVEDAIFPTQKVAYDTFGGAKGDYRKNLDIEVNRSCAAQYAHCKNFDSISRQVGYPPMSQKDMDTLIGHLYDEPFRRKVRYRIEKYRKKGELISAREIVLQVLNSKKPSK